MKAIAILSEDQINRLSAIASRIASNHDGEALNAARMTCRELDRHGLRIGGRLS